VTLRQTMPFGMETPLVLVPASTGLTVEAKGLRAMPERADAQGNRVLAYELGTIAPGGELVLTARGLLARDHSGRPIAGALCLLLVAAAIVGARRPRKGPGTDPRAREKLAERREKFFTELIEIERARRAAGASDNPGALAERRAETVAKLEGVYRDLDRLEREGEA
jgi:hypothetical protein